MQKRNLYWAVWLHDGQLIRGVKEGAVCSPSKYVAILKRQHKDWHHVVVSTKDDAHIIM